MMFRCNECGCFLLNPFQANCLRCARDVEHDRKLFARDKIEWEQFEKTSERLHQLQQENPSTLLEKQNWITERDTILSQMSFFSIASFPTIEQLKIVSDLALECLQIWRDCPEERLDHALLTELSNKGAPSDLINAAGEMLSIIKKAQYFFDDDEDFRKWVLEAKMDMPSSICLFDALVNVAKLKTESVR